MSASFETSPGEAARRPGTRNFATSDENAERMVVAVDMDGTVIPVDSQTVAARLMVRRGLLPLRAVVEAQAWLTATWLGLPTADAETLQRRAIAYLAGRPEHELAQLCDDVVRTRLLPAIRADAREVITSWRRAGAFVVLASASLEPLVAPVADAVDADAYVATRMTPVRCGRLSGRIEGRRLSGVHKREAVEALANACFCRWRLLAAYGDHVSDLPLLETADMPVAVTPTARLRRHARRAGWSIVQWR